MPFLLLYSLYSLLQMKFPWAREEASAASPPPEHESRASLHQYHIFLRATRKYNFNFMRASRVRLKYLLTGSGVPEVTYF